MGDISPAALRQRVNLLYPESSHAPSEIDTMARIGQRFLKAPSSSGTAENAAVGTGLGLGGEALSGLAGMILGHGYQPGLGAAASLGSTWAGARAANTLLRNQTLARQAVQGSLNPGRFRFNYLPGMGVPQAAPFALAPLTPQDAIQPPQ